MSKDKTVTFRLTGEQKSCKGVVRIEATESEKDSVLISNVYVSREIAKKMGIKKLDGVRGIELTARILE